MRETLGIKTLGKKKARKRGEIRAIYINTTIRRMEESKIKLFGGKRVIQILLI